MDRDHIFKEYTRIIKQEREQVRQVLLHSRTPRIWHVLKDANLIYDYTLQFIEIAKSSLLPRAFNKVYGINSKAIAPESVGSHTNLMSILVDRALISIYGPDFSTTEAEHQCTIDGFTYREVIEAVHLHDLPENEIGDWPDNGSYDDTKKALLEQDFLQRFKELYPQDEQLRASTESAIRLISAMNDHRLPTSDLLKVADKTAALLTVLYYDKIGMPPVLHIGNPNLSKRDIKEMEICDNSPHENGLYKASEMWTIDFFKMRRFNEIDESGFFTAIIIMYTLIVNGRWYNWREKDYEQQLP